MYLEELEKPFYSHTLFIRGALYVCNIHLLFWNREKKRQNFLIAMSTLQMIQNSGTNQVSIYEASLNILD